MSIKQVAPISDHYEQAIGRTHQFIKDLTKTYTVSWSSELVSGWEVIIHAFTSPAQEMEGVMNDMLDNRGIRTAEGVNLDRIGQIVGSDRGGSTDTGYFAKILAQIGANNSDTTARDLLSITNIFMGDDLREVSLNESFPAKVTIDYLAEIQFNINSTNNAFTVQVDLGGGSPLLPVVLPDGDYFPHELASLASDLIEAAWGQPLLIDFTALREYLFNIDTVPVLVNPAINWGTAGPVYGFTDGQTISTTDTGSPVAGPVFDSQDLSDVLDSAKAAGVNVDALTVALGNFFGFSNDAESLGFGAFVSLLNHISYYTTWTFPTGLGDIGFNRYLSNGSNGFSHVSFGVTVLVSEIAAFTNELDTVSTGFDVVDKSGVRWTYVNDAGLLDYTVDDQTTQYRVNINMTNALGDVALGRLFKDSVEQLMPFAFPTFDFDDWFRGDEVAFNAANPSGLGNTTSVQDVVIGGGIYSTIL